MIVIGLDPGIKTGVCYFKDGEYSHCTTMTPLETLRTLAQLEPETIVLIEDSNLQSFNFTAAKASGSTELKLKIARDVGKVDMVSHLYVNVASDRPGVEVIRVSPLKKGAKFPNTTRLESVTGLKLGKLNQHERDALQLAFPYRHAGRF